MHNKKISLLKYLVAKKEALTKIRKESKALRTKVEKVKVDQNKSDK